MSMLHCFFLNSWHEVALNPRKPGYLSVGERSGAEITRAPVGSETVKDEVQFI